jgi:RNA polymerase sigma factor (sigma-70 family)
MTRAPGETREAPLATLYRDCYGELVGYLERLAGERASAEDIAQEAGIRLLEAGEREPLANPRAFLFHVATNLARDLLRRRMTRDAALPELTAVERFEPGADAVAAAREEIGQVGAALAQLPERAREVLVLARIEGLSHAEIGERLGIAPKTVENHLGRALARLAALLGRDRPGGTH